MGGTASAGYLTAQGAMDGTTYSTAVAIRATDQIVGHSGNVNGRGAACVEVIATLCARLSEIPLGEDIDHGVGRDLAYGAALIVCHQKRLSGLDDTRRKR
jgi:hypothetical protein